MSRASAVLFMQPAVDFGTLLGLLHQALGYKVSEAADGNRRDLSSGEKLLSCLAAMKDRRAPVGLPQHLQSFISYGVFLACDERDMLEVLECASTMSFSTVESDARGISVGVVVGTLAQWRDAVRAGATASVAPTVREMYCKIMGLFENAGLGHAWADFVKKPSIDNQFYLEDKRR